MGMTTYKATLDGLEKTLLAGSDTNGNLVPGHMLTSSSGVEIGTASNPLQIAMTNTPGVQPVSLAAIPALAAGTATIGNVGQAGGPWTVSFSGQSVAAMQSGAWMVSLATGATVALGAGTAAIGTVGVTGSVAVTGAFYPDVQPVSGSLTLASGATVNVGSIGGSLPAGTNTLGAVTQASGPWAVSWSGQSVAATQSGTWTVGLANGSSVSLAAGSATIGSVGVIGSVAVTGSFYPSTQPISAASLPLPSGAATAAGQSALHTDGGSLAHITNLPATQAITATALPLPTGAATASNQPALHSDGGSLSHITNLPATQTVSGTITVGNTSLFVAGTSAVGSAPVNAPVSVAGVDGSGNKQHLLTDVAGRQVVVIPSGAGTDVSGSAPAVGNVLGTLIVATPGAYFVQNQSAATLQVAFDSGSGTPSIMLLAPGNGANTQGADTSPAMPWFVGRIRVAGPAGSQFMARSN